MRALPARPGGPSVGTSPTPMSKSETDYNSIGGNQMTTNFITCDTYQFMNFVTGEVIEFRALVEGATRGWTLEDAIRDLVNVHGEDHAFSFMGHVEREWDDTEYSPEDFEDEDEDDWSDPLGEEDRKRERDTEGLNPPCWGYTTEGYEEDWEEDDDWDDDWDDDPTRCEEPAWCEETGWYE